MTNNHRLFIPPLSHVNCLLSQWIMTNMKTACIQADKRLNKWKNKLFQDAKGDVLEIGAGSGINRKYLKNNNYLALEPNGHFKDELSGISDRFICSSAEKIPLPSKSIDTVISSMTLCSVKCLDKVLSEVYRVLKPKGEFIVLEHVGAPKGTWLRFWQCLLMPVFKVLDNGCQIDRDIVKAIRNSKFHTLYWEEFNLKFKTPFVQNWLAARLVK